MDYILVTELTIAEDPAGGFCGDWNRSEEFYSEAAAVIGSNPKDAQAGSPGPVASAAAGLTGEDWLEYCVYFDRGKAGCYIGVSNPGMTGELLADLKRRGYTAALAKNQPAGIASAQSGTGSANAKSPGNANSAGSEGANSAAPGSRFTEFILTRELMESSELIPDQPPKFSYRVAALDNIPMKRAALAEAIGSAGLSGGFSVIFGAGRYPDRALSNRIGSCNPDRLSVLDRMLRSPRLYPAVICSFSEDRATAELIADYLCGIYPGLVKRKIETRPVSAGLLGIDYTDSKARFIGRLSNLYTPGELSALGDMRGLGGDFGIPCSKDSLISDNSANTLPPAELKLGQNAYGQWLGIPFSALSRHLFIGGAPGQGKGNLLALIAFQLKQAGIPFLMIESSKTELHHLRKVIEDLKVWRTEPGQFVLNPLAIPEDITLGEYRQSLNSILRVLVDMEGSLENLIGQALDRCFALRGYTQSSRGGDPSLKPFGICELIEEYRKLLKFQYSGETNANMTAAGTNRLMTPLIENRALYDSVNSVPVKELISGYNLLQLNSLTTPESKQLFGTLLLTSLGAWLRLRMSNPGGGTRLVILMDESHNLLKEAVNSRSETAYSFARDFEALLLEMRSLGVGFVIADQSSHNLPRGLAEACGTKIFLGGNPYSGVKDYAETMKLSEASLANLYRLGPGEGLLYSEGMSSARVFRSPNAMDLLSVSDAAYPAENSFLKAHPDFTLKTFAQCSNCSVRDNCSFDIKNSGRALALKLYMDLAPYLRAASREKDKDKRRTILAGLAAELEARTRSLSPEQSCCSIIQFAREARLRFSLPIDGPLLADTVLKRRSSNGI